MKSTNQTRIRQSLQMSVGLALSLGLFASLITGSIGADTRPSLKTSIRSDLLAQVEKELARLNTQAEQESGPEWPRPSTRVAYLLLTGLAVQGSLMERLPKSEQEFLGIEKGSSAQARLFEVTPDARVALIDRWVNDKAGSYLLRHATFYVRKEAKWMSKGHGTATGDK
jgi:hypothetical protein